MGEADEKKVCHKPDDPIKARLVGLAPMTVAKLAQARIKTLADMKRLTEEDLKRLPLALVEYAAVKRFIASLTFEGGAVGPDGVAAGSSAGDAPQTPDS
jgi:hypothetical protein